MVCKKWKFIALQSRRVFVLQPWKSKEEENIKIYNIQALQLICQHKVDQAITLLSKILEFYPNSIKVFLYRAKAYQQKKKYDEALTDIGKAIQLEPRFVEAYQQRVELYKEIFSQAIAELIIKDLSTIIELNPQLDSCYSDRGFAYLILKKHNEAYMDVTTAIKKNPKNSRSYLARSILIMMKDSNSYTNQLAALYDCSLAIQFCPNNSFNYQNRAFILTKLQRPTDALADYAKVSFYDFLSVLFILKKKTFL